MQASSLPKLFLTAYCYMLLVTLTQSMPIGTTYSRDTSNTATLKSLVEKAVNTTSLSCNNFTDSSNNDITSILTNKIIQNARESGYKLKKTCTPLTNEQLLKLFKNDTKVPKTSCVVLTAIGDGPNQEYVMSTNSSCLTDLNQHAQCLPQLQSHCSTTPTIDYISNGTNDDYFPRFVLSVKCGGCTEEDETCLIASGNCVYRNHMQPFHLLKREPDKCDEGMEVWNREEKMVNVGCSCLKHSSL